MMAARNESFRGSSQSEYVDGARCNLLAGGCQVEKLRELEVLTAQFQAAFGCDLGQLCPLFSAPRLEVVQGRGYQGASL